MAVTVDLPADSRAVARQEVAWPSWWVPAEAEVEWAELQAVLARVVPPCRSDPEAWFAARVRPADFVAHEAAVEACGWCPAVVECRAYALAANEREGVWGGLTAAERGARR